MKGNSPLMSKLLKKNDFTLALPWWCCASLSACVSRFLYGEQCGRNAQGGCCQRHHGVAVMLGIIAGGIDVSFPAIALCSMYITSKLCDQFLIRARSCGQSARGAIGTLWALSTA
jgi:ribose/xylose/arabinose/galactoside ABC-type transport system permease subunit